MSQLRSTSTRGAGWKARLVTTSVAIAALAGPAAAQDLLVSNLSTSASGREGLADSEYIQSFTTGPNVSGYLLESISIDFVKGSVGARDPVYVYLYEDNGSGRPRSRAIATLTKNGVNFAPPVTGVNKYKVWKARCYSQPPHGGGCLQDPSSVHLAPNTTYWVYVWAGRSTTGAELQSDTVTTETGAAGWTLGDSAFSKPSWGSSDGVYTYTSISAPLLIKVEGTTNPEVLVSVNDVTVTEGTHKTANFVVSLSRKTSGPVQVSYGTVQLSGSSAADEGSDYEATSGTLTFRPGQARKTVSVPILDDARNEGDETFGLALTNLQGATFAVNSGTGTIVNAEPLALSISDATATEGVDATIDFTVSLNRATTRRITVNVLFSSGTANFSDITEPDQTSVTFEPGQRRRTYSLGIVDDSVNEPSETFSMVLQVPGLFTGDIIVGSPGTGTILNTETLEASFENVPQDHDGSNTFTFNVAFTNDVSIGPAAMRDHAFTVTNGDVTGASRVDGRNDRWLITVDPDGDDAVTITLPGNRACATQGAICSKEDNPVQLSNSPSATVAAPPEGDPLTASFSNVPDDHDGSDFHVDLTFSEGPDVGYRDVQKAVKVSGGSINRTNRKTKGSNVGWKLKVRPAGTGSLTITLPATTNCSARGAICTEDGRRLSNSPSATVAGPAAVVETTPTVSIAGGSGTEGDDDSIAFTVTLDEAASETVTVDYATADGSAEAGDDYTAASGTLSFAAGETSKAISVAIDDDIVNESDETFTVTLSNASGADLGTKTATGTIRNRTVALLTASFEDVPSEHDGSTVFTFRLRFSEDPAVSYRVLRDEAFSVSGGTVKKARRVDGRNDLREIHVQPETTGEIRISLPATTDCDAVDAICTEDGRPLSHSLSETIASPVGISVADARVEEGAGAVLEFAVTLSRAAAGQVTVDYQTANGTASAGTDYTAANGTLTFRAGESSKTVEVAVLDDSHDEGEETMTLRLSNPSEGRLADAEATGTIENTDPLPRGLLARFGRATALHVMEQVEERLEASRASGFRGRFAGRELRRGMERDMGRNFLSRLESTAGAGARDTTGVQSDLSPTELLRTGLGGGDVLMGSGFVLNRETGAGASVSLWSRGMESRFSGRDGELSLDGGVRTTMFGADYAKGPLMAGLMLSHRRGLGGYQGADVGQVASSVTGLHPWVGYKLTERVTLWGVTGYGRGSLSLTPGEAMSLPTSVPSPVALKGGLSMSMLAGGVRGDLVDAGIGGFGLAFKADALWVGTGSEAVDGPAGRLAGTEAVVTRVRTALEASRGYVFGHGIALRPSLEVGLRRDGGDAETGVGADVAASLIASDPLTGLSVDVRVRTLLVHQDEGFRERGVSVSFSYDPTPQTPLGFTARVAPSWGGQAMSGADALWGRDTMEGLGAAGPGSGDRIDAELGYALPVGSRLVGTPRFGVTTSEYGRDYRLGYSLAVVQGGAMSFQFGLDAQRRESLLQDKPDHSLVGRLTVGW